METTHVSETSTLYNHTPGNYPKEDNIRTFKVSPASLQTYLAADRQGQEDTSLTLTLTVILNSNYVIMVGD
jgi:hypothetical protein